MLTISGSNFWFKEIKKDNLNKNETFIFSRLVWEILSQPIFGFEKLFDKGVPFMCTLLKWLIALQKIGIVWNCN